jgi:hypothetical protein
MIIQNFKDRKEELCDQEMLRCISGIGDYFVEAVYMAVCSSSALILRSYCKYGSKYV